MGTNDKDKEQGGRVVNPKLFQMTIPNKETQKQKVFLFL